MKLFKRKTKKLAKVKQNPEQSLTTINDLFTQDNINKLLEELQELKPRLRHLILIYETNEDMYSWRTSGEDLTTTQAIGLLHRTILDINDEPEIDDD